METHMKKISTKQLKIQYESICGEYLRRFIKKQGYEFSGWISGEIGSIAGFIEQYYFSFDDIYFDINEECPRGMIFSWQDHNLEVGIDNCINYYSYSKGLRMNIDQNKSVTDNIDVENLDSIKELKIKFNEMIDGEIYKINKK
jgi:hypothetical protein